MQFTALSASIVAKAVLQAEKRILLSQQPEILGLCSLLIQLCLFIYFFGDGG